LVGTSSLPKFIHCVDTSHTILEYNLPMQFTQPRANAKTDVIQYT